MSKWSGVIASMSWMSSLTGVMGPLFRIDSTSHKYVCNYSSLKIQFFDTAHNVLLLELIIESHDPPMRELRGGLQLRFMHFVLRWWLIFLLFRLFIASRSFDSAPIKPLPLSIVIPLT